MDISTIEPPVGLTAKQARDWLRELPPTLMFMEEPQTPPQDLGAELVLAYLPGRLRTQLVEESGESILGSLSQAMSDWIHREKMMEYVPSDTRNTRSHWSRSTRGITYCVGKALPRKKSNAAWDEVAGYVARCVWNNLAPATMAPFRVDDVFLFGSMLKPDAKDYGDADVMALSHIKDKSTWSWLHAHDGNIRSRIPPMTHLFYETPCWQSILRRNLHAGRGFLSEDYSLDQLSFFQKNSTLPPMVSLMKSVTKVSRDETTRNSHKSLLDLADKSLSKGKESISSVQSQLSAAFRRQGLTSLPELLSGRAPTTEELTALAQHAVAPLVRRVAKRLATSVAADVDGEDIRHGLPNDVALALWTASFFEEGRQVAMDVLHQTAAAAALGVGAMIRSIQADQPALAAQWHQSYVAWSEKNKFTSSDRTLLEFKGDTTYRPELAPLRSHHVPPAIRHCAMKGDWKAVAEWKSRGGDPYFGWGSGKDFLPAWGLLLETMLPLMKQGDIEEKLADHVKKFRDAGLSLTEIGPEGQTLVSYLGLDPSEISLAKKMRARRKQEVDSLAPSVSPSAPRV